MIIATQLIIGEKIFGRLKTDKRLPEVSMKKRLNTIVVLGSGGMLGSTVAEYFGRNNYEVIKLDRRTFDVLTDPLLKLEKKIIRADVVINCLGLIKPTIGNCTPQEALVINGIFPVNLARVCQRLKIKCFHITTDCVFSGKKGRYTEHDLVDAMDLYGLTKAAGDTDLCMTIRTSIIGEESGKSRSLLEWIKSQKDQPVNGFVNHKWNGVTTLELAKCIEKIISRDWFELGVYHVFSPQIVSKYELLRIVNEVYGLNLQIIKTKAQEAVDRSLSSQKSLTKKLKITPIKDQVMEMMNFFYPDEK
ncbi:MAG: hypothetical protein ACD_72C00011G0002 [uncultured bacterium]|nr:MAG: hypothetical protein ACD_72C00011G0002 [uncultured bacterium]